MAGVNFAVLVGNVGRDPEVRATQAGGKVAGFSIATSETWKDRGTGERRERTEWHRIVVFSEGLVGVVERYVHKGSRVFVKGTLRTRKWAGQDGIERYTTEVHLSGFDAQLVLLDRAGPGGPPPADDPGPGGGPGHRTADSGPAPRDDLDDEIPF